VGWDFDNIENRPALRKQVKKRINDESAA